MKTLFNAIRAAIFGAGFIFLWGWVALGVRGDIRYTRGGNAGAVRSAAQVCRHRALPIRAQSNVCRWFHRAFWLRAVRAVARDSGVHPAMASIGASLCDFVRRAASPGDVWRALRGVSPIGAPLVAPALPPR